MQQQPQMPTMQQPVQEIPQKRRKKKRKANGGGGKIWLSVLVLVIFTVFYHRIFAVTFDETFAQATGMKTSRYNLLIAIVTASVIVLAMKLVGSLLISALIIFPALSAMRIFKSFRAVILASVVVSVFCSSVGILLSILGSTPVGATIVCMNIVVFCICSLIGFLMERG